MVDYIFLMHDDEFTETTLYRAPGAMVARQLPFNLQSAGGGHGEERKDNKEEKNWCSNKYPCNSDRRPS